MEDEREEAKSFDKYTADTFKNNVLVGHMPTGLSRLIYYFFKSHNSSYQCTHQSERETEKKK